MSVRYTTSDNVALFDSATGRTFGEVFVSEEEAVAFLEFAQEGWEGDLRDPRAYDSIRRDWNESETRKQYVE